MFKVLFVCARFGEGGAEMHLLRVLKHADFTKFDVHLALTRDKGNYEERLPEQVTIHHLTSNVNSSALALLKSYLPLKKLVKDLDPDAIVSFMDPQNLLLAFLKKNSRGFPPIILACQNAPVKNLSNDGLLGKVFLTFLPKWYDKYADKIIAICEGVRDELKDTLHIKAPVKVIYNAGFDESFAQSINETLPVNAAKSSVQIVACGRLTKQKGFDVLINAIKLLKQDIDLNLWILGKGEDEEKLNALRDALGLHNKINFLGFQSNPYKFFHNADIFVLSSRWEGFGNVITEAMVCGCAVVATNCDYGPGEIITDKVNGLLCEVENAGSLAKNIEYLVENKAARHKMIKNGYTRAMDFTSAEISRKYFDEIVKSINKVNE